MTTTTYAAAPEPPAGPGEPLAPVPLTHYLQELGRWRVRRQRELDILDEVAAARDDSDETADDLTLSMALWHAAAQRYDLLVTAAESSGPGGPDADTRERINRLVWGLIEQPGTETHNLSLSLPQACQLSDALASALRSRLQVDDSAGIVADRVHAVQARVARVAELVADLPEDDREEEQARLASLEEGLARLEAHLQSAEAGRQDTSGPQDADLRPELGRLESLAAITERDLILDAVRRAHGRADPEHVARVREELVTTADAVRVLAGRALDTLDPAPHLAIPDVEALGEVPQDRAELTAYLAGLERVDRALEQAHITYAAALARHTELLDRAEALAATLSGTGAPTSVDLAGMLSRTIEALHNVPADLQRAAALIGAQEAYLAEMRSDR
ncbi:hypothetical protein [Ornithinimicrobium sediminis]|uniref:hypothetical protein n=1 Tax=Ornithinimicrobium sediminis TaxID=2904603 RepID=UPI001E650DFA|nr:hypothetical protein [Ornithinimicrobium sediminis]MCE0487948.1 hypothetical protein [Ornithinimicrobium sediminis]